MGARVLRAAAPGERLLGGSRAGRPLRGARGGADRGASQGHSGHCCCCRGRRLVRARLLQPPPPPLPPHVPPARPGSRSVPPATNGRRVLASQQPIAGGAVTPHTPLSWKEPRHPRPAARAPLPVPRRPHPRRRRRGRGEGGSQAPPACSPAQPVARAPEVGGSAVTLRLPAHSGPPLARGAPRPREAPWEL